MPPTLRKRSASPAPPPKTRGRSASPAPSKTRGKSPSPGQKVKKSPARGKSPSPAPAEAKKVKEGKKASPVKPSSSKSKVSASSKGDADWAVPQVDSGFIYKLGLRSALGPLLLMCVTPIIPTSFLITCNHFEGKFVDFLRAVFNSPAEVWNLFPPPTWHAFQIIVAYFAWQWAFLYFLPGKYYTGPKTESNQMPVYRENALLAFFLTHAILIAGLSYGYIDGVAIFDSFPNIVSITTPGAFLICIALYIKGRFFSDDPDKRVTDSFVWDFYWGVEIHPRFLGVNVKQWLNCRVAMMGWASILIIYVAKQYDDLKGDVTNGLLISVFLQLVYIYKFFVWESGYMHSIDIILDRAGYYIIWGVLAWLPTIYTIHSYYLVKFPHELSSLNAAAVLAFGLLSIGINYQADWQRQNARSTNGKCNVWWGVPAEVIPAKYTTKDGVEHSTLLLVNGWWGVASHFNYLPELCLALSWSLPAKEFEIVPYFYPIYLTILLVDRATRDDKRCTQKYGKYWAAYKEKVPYSMIPGVF